MTPGSCQAVAGSGPVLSRLRSRMPAPQGDLMATAHGFDRGDRVTRMAPSNGAYTMRLADRSDAPAIARIHNEGIEDRTATFETVLRTADQVESGIAERGDRHPTVVVERNGSVVAWASVGAYRSRACYDGIGEVSVYVARDARGFGVGTMALHGLIGACETRGFWKLVSRLFPENIASRALCRSLGFREVGIYRRHARLDGQWRDCVVVELLIGDAALPG